jgi:LmbE family N-acetylglucosaminyl deacetylase
MTSYKTAFVFIICFVFSSLRAATTVFFIPHPDDEVLSMGCGILKDLRDSNDVYIILMTHGEGSGAIYTINGSNQKNDKTYCFWHRKYHDPKTEGYSPLSKTEFGNMRIKEFKQTVNALGVKEQNEIIYNFPDGFLPEDSVRNIMLNFEKNHPKTLFRTTSWFDLNHDHHVLGSVLKGIHDSLKISDALFFCSPAQWNECIAPSHFEKSKLMDSTMRVTLAIYHQWKPMNQSFAIGYHSVAQQFELLNYAPKSKIHGAEAERKVGFFCRMKAWFTYIIYKIRKHLFPQLWTN